MTSDPQRQFRPYRTAAWAGYLVVAVGFSLLIIVSVYRSVLAMSPPRVASEAGPVLSEGECWGSVRQQFQELESGRKRLGEAPQVAHADQRFLEMRVNWLKRLRDLEAQCAVSQRPQLKEALVDLEHLLDLYTTASVQFSGAVGPAVDDFKSRLK